MPFVQHYPPRVDPDVRCTESPLDLPLQAEIWCYTPETNIWERVYQSPKDVPVVGHPGKTVARDIGYRGMMVYKERDGTEALYVSGVSARTINRGGAPPRLLRSTDGVHFDSVPHDPGTTLGEIPAIGYRSPAAYKGRFYVTAGYFYGEGALYEAEDPAGGNDHFRQVTPPGMRVFDLVPFNGSLYLGLRHLVKGYSVVKTDATGIPPYRFTNVVPAGGYRKPWPSHAALSLQVFQDKLYVGTDGPAELIRIHPDDTWDLVVGNPRRTPDGVKRPISGMGDGFGYDLNRLVHRLQVHDGWLYAGTACIVAVKLRKFPILGRYIRKESGFDLYATRDGVHYTVVTRDGFGEMTSGMLRTFASTPVGLFVGATDEHFGCRVYLGSRAQRAGG